MENTSSSSRSPTRPPEGVPAGREDQSWGRSWLPKGRAEIEKRGLESCPEVHSS